MALTDDDLIASLAGTIREEAAALSLMAGAVDAAWLGAVRTLHHARLAGGRIVVAGVGKSGHVGAKIAATLASTGAPALFVHGTEASHGDLGMIGPRDVVLMLSASGSTRELIDLASFAKRRNLPLVLISKKADGALGKLASVVMRLPDVPEACPNGQAPTTSSTATLAAGDAIAIALMRLAGFGADDFRALHPGGALGAAPQAG